jgi:hypothetical protein
MTQISRSAGSLIVLAALAAGCENAPPGGGMTNGEDPRTITAPETSAVRSDMPVPAQPPNPNQPIAGAADFKASESNIAPPGFPPAAGSGSQVNTPPAQPPATSPAPASGGPRPTAKP